MFISISSRIVFQQIYVLPLYIIHCQSNFILAQPYLKPTLKPEVIMTNCVLWGTTIFSFSRQVFLLIVQLMCVTRCMLGSQTTTVGSAKADALTKNLKMLQGRDNYKWDRLFVNCWERLEMEQTSLVVFKVKVINFEKGHWSKSDAWQKK